MDQELKDMLTAILARTERLDDKFKSLSKQTTDSFNNLDKRVAKVQLSLENEIKPDLQAIRENQTEVINQKAHITKVETKVYEVKDDVDVLKIVAQEHSKDIEQLKKRA